MSSPRSQSGGSWISTTLRRKYSPEFLAFYEKREVSVSRCDEPNVHGLGLTRTDAADLALLEHS